MKKENSQTRLLKRYYLASFIVWALFILFFAFMDIRQESEKSVEIATNRAKSSIERDLIFREWAASQGGIYVMCSPQTQPNPYLQHLKERDLITKNDKKLTLVNPAYMMRQILNNYESRDGTYTHLTSRKAINPKNNPDGWEEKNLPHLSSTRQEFIGLVKQGEKEHLRMLQALFITPECLKCHGHQGYKVGDIRGALSVSVPMLGLRTAEQQALFLHFLYLGFVWLLGIVATSLFYHRLSSAIRHREALQQAEIRHEVLKNHHEELKCAHAELAEALEKVKLLSGFLPICASCKKIRDDQGYWNQIEEYIRAHSEAEFSHSLCPECSHKLYPEFHLPKTVT